MLCKNYRSKNNVYTETTRPLSSNQFTWRVGHQERRRCRRRRRDRDVLLIFDASGRRDALRPSLKSTPVQHRVQPASHAPFGPTAEQNRRVHIVTSDQTRATQHTTNASRPLTAGPDFQNSRVSLKTIYGVHYTFED